MQIIKPYNKEIKNLNFKNGNFGLWFNKFIPINYNFNNSDINGNHEEAAKFYLEQYKNIVLNKDLFNNFLKEIHLRQIDFCNSFKSNGYEILTITCILKSPLIIGIGETHPSEISMVFDHNLGIPYIPSSSIKGIVRLGHIIDLLNNKNIIKSSKYHEDKDGNLYIDDEEEWTKVPELFGTIKNRGNVIFLDAYPLQKPKLKVDIMNPHYGEYYNLEKPPSDNLKPIPIKFLSVKKETEFVFRTLISKEINELNKIIEYIKKAYERALIKEGVGAKTAVGYGRFEIIFKEPEIIDSWINQRKVEIQEKEEKLKREKEEKRIKNMTHDDRMIYEISKLKKNNEDLTQKIGEVWSQIKNENYSKEVYKKLKEKLIEVDEWEPKGSKKKKEKMKKRQEEIQEKLNA